MRVIFIGSSEFGIPALRELLLSQNHQVLAVITQPDKPKGRSGTPSPTPIGSFILEHTEKCPLYKPENINSPEMIKLLTALDPDILVTASYGAMIGKALRTLGKYKAVNLHPSLLPKLRGASPIQHAILCGENLTGTSLFRLNARLDAGDILLQRQLCICEKENYLSLHNRLAELSKDVLMDYLASPDSYKPQPQNDASASYCGKFDKADYNINWNETAEHILSQIRAFAPEPGAYTFLNGKQLKILEAEPGQEDKANGLRSIPGKLHKLYKNIGLGIETGSDELIIKMVQPAGKKPMPAWAYYLGLRVNSKSDNALESAETILVFGG